MRDSTSATMAPWPMSGAAVLSKRSLPLGASIKRVPCTAGGANSGFRFRLLGEHVGAAADLAADQPALAQQLIGPADSADGGADIISEVALRRQFCPGVDDAAIDI